MSNNPKMSYWITPLLFLISFICNASCCLPPKPFDVHSENRKFVVHITPFESFKNVNGRRERLAIPIKAHAAVSHIKNGKRIKQWEVDLKDRYCPDYAYLSNDGESLITFEGVVVRFYRNQVGFQKEYMIHEDVYPDFKKYLGRGDIGLTSAGIHWDKYSIMFFDKDKDVNYFCIWVDWYGRWVAWNIETATLIKVSKEQNEKWNKKALEWSLKELKKNEDDGDHRTAIIFLASLKEEKYIDIIKQQMPKYRFSNHSYSTIGETSSLNARTYKIFSYEVKVADRAIAKFSGLTSRGYANIDEYFVSGSLYGAIELPEPLKEKGRGVILLKLKKLNAKPKIEYIVAIGIDGIKTDQKDKIVRFDWRGVPPGDYEMSAIWKKDKEKEDLDRFEFSPGDFVSDKVKIRVKANEVLKGFTIQCLNKDKAN